MPSGSKRRRPIQIPRPVHLGGGLPARECRGHLPQALRMASYVGEKRLGDALSRTEEAIQWTDFKGYFRHYLRYSMFFIDFQFF